MPDLDFFNTISPLDLEEVAAIGGCKIHAAGNVKKLHGVAPIDSATANDLTFLSNQKYASSLKNSKAGACILNEANISKAPDGMAMLVSKNPYASYAKIAAKFYPDDERNGEISPAAFIDSSASIGKNCTIEAGAFIGKNVKIGNNTYIASGAYLNKGVKIGNNCTISHNVTLSHTIIGNNVLLHPGVRIGQDGFGFATENGVHIKVPQLGRVIIEDYVEIGANTCIDRGAGPDTVIGQGTQIDNLVQIGHNVKTGKGCVIVSQAGISGSTKLGDYVILGGQVGVAGHLNIGSMVNIAAKSGVAQDIEPKQIIGGYPAVPIRQWHRQSISLAKLAKGKDKEDE
ncbi:MAG: UDP-3-O-[3-hydroxymyristoyl] glucosamine N-acyltransferase [Rickettsiaceae bacterium]|jgi:UDP-3-O-[3-hydroxymyristoyl] glucosamine N-acyltransferase|nr:UDP-3-O-[3-hydroxymyristoyl] glucosamine N-acyltransferase [Rickettsiaceae bacterium]